MSMSFPPPFIVPSTARHELTVIVLHGRGDTAQNFTYGFFLTLPSGAKDSQAPITYLPKKYPNVKWVFPGAKKGYSSVFRQHISEWFDIASLIDPEKENERQRQGLIDSVNHVRGIVEQEARELRESHGDDKKRVVLGGISMGCATSVHVLMSMLANGNDCFAGYFGWCGWLPFRTRLEERLSLSERDTDADEAVTVRLRDFYKEDLVLAPAAGPPSNCQTGQECLQHVPVILSHCSDDGTVNVELGRQLRMFTGGLGLNVRWTEYGSGGHWIKSPEAMDDFEKFLDEQVETLALK